MLVAEGNFKGEWTLKINLQQTLPNKLYLFVKRRFNFFKKSLISMLLDEKQNDVCLYT
jgi:hypothetical protein